MKLHCKPTDGKQEQKTQQRSKQEKVVKEKQEDADDQINFETFQLADL